MQIDPVRLADRIYEAAIIPELWPSVLADISAYGDGAMASVYVQTEVEIRWVGTPEADRLIGDYAALKEPNPNSRIARAEGLVDGFVSDLDIFTEAEIARDRFYQEFLYPRGYGWVAARQIVPPSGERIILSIERLRTRGPFEQEVIRRLDNLGGHFARAALLSARLNFTRAKGMSDALQTLGLPSAVLSAQGDPIVTNSLFEALMPLFAQDRRDRLRLTDATADALLATAIEAMPRANGDLPVCSIPVAAVDDRPPMIVHLVPVRGAANDVFGQAASLLIVTPVDRAAVPSAEVLQGLFDLTPAEARVARGIGGARTIDDLSAATGVSRETVRSQLKAVLDKTGLSRQQELVSLLAGKAMPGRGFPGA